MKHQDMYIRLVDPAGKHPTQINARRVWDRERFYQAQVNFHANPNRQAEDRRFVSVATEIEYLESLKVTP